MNLRAQSGIKKPIIKSDVVGGVNSPANLLSWMGKEISVMAWIEDAFGNVLLVKQKKGRSAWAFPGGKVASREALLNGLRRELKEEIGVTVDVATPMDIFDRSEKANLTILFRVILVPTSVPKPNPKEIEKLVFRRTLPKVVTPSLRYFWMRSQKTFDPMSNFI